MRLTAVIRYVFAAPLLVALLGVTAASAQCRFQNLDSESAVLYRFSLDPTAAGMQLKIGMTFRMAAGKAEELDVPSEFIRGLHVVGGNAALHSDASGAETITAATGGLISLSYTLSNGWAGPLVHPHEFQPVILPQYTEVTGDKALVSLRARSAASVRVSFDWQAMPATWALATSFGAAASMPPEGRPPATVLQRNRCQTYTGPWSAVHQALFAAGDFRLRTFRIGRQNGVLAIRGAWRFTDKQAADEVGRTIGLVRDFWQDDAFPYFLVTVQPFDQDHGSSDGTAFTNAFWMYLSRGDDLRGLLPQLAHESFHAWNPLKMGSLSQAQYEKTKWFTEGFTEYYARKLTYAGQEISADALVRTTNKDLLAFPSSTNEYVRGAVIALWLDAEIRQQSRGKASLDSVMFRLVRDRRLPLTEERILATAAPLLSQDALALLRKAAEQQGDLPAPATIPSLRECYRARYGEYPTFDLGLDSRASRSANAITGVTVDGPAYQAGLRDGQTMLSASFDRDDPGRQAVFTIRVHGTEKTIAYQPLGPLVSRWQYLPGAESDCAPLP